MTDVEALLTRLYEAFNRQALDELLSAMHPDVQWPNYIEGGLVHGVPALREYWTAQFGKIIPEAVPIRFDALPEDRVCVTLAYAARSRDGDNLWLDDIMTNTFTFRDGLIARMEWGVPTAGVLPPETLVERLIEAFNRRDAAAAVALMHPHVDWPDVFGPDRLKGRQAVQAMWTYRFDRWNTHVSLLEMTKAPAGSVRMRATYASHHRDGRLSAERIFLHNFEFRDGFISKMTVEAA